MIHASDLLNFSNILEDVEETHPAIIAIVATILIGVCAWSISIYISRQSKSNGSRRRRGKVRRGTAAPPRVTQGAMAPLVDAIKPSDRQILGDDLVKLIERHRNKRFTAFVVVTRANVNPITFVFLYQALRSENRPMTEVHEFQVSVRDANEILRACLAKQPQA
jgi:hypothetical protein